jgi:uncharacterized protein (TIGR03083 family)
MTSADDFTHASQAFIDVVTKIGPEQWDRPGLGNWDVRALVGHTARALLTVENYLELDEPGRVSITSAEHYYRTIYAEYTDPKSVEERGFEAGKWLGDDPLDTIQAARDRALKAVAAQPPDRIVSIGGLGILLSEYLRTRVFELVVHTLDISRATGADYPMGSTPLGHAVSLAAQVAVERGHGPDVLLALTGRAALPDGFNVV